ncbi:MAG: AraC family transcriptional regulator [Armatimonadetes bacterium]|nr:AraC family transcriptional regulator [Armatimonadota bacterium]
MSRQAAQSRFAQTSQAGIFKGPDQPVEWFRRALIFKDADEEEVYSFTSATTGASHVYGLGNLRCRASASRVQFGPASVIYWDIGGGVINAATALGSEFVIGSVVAGKVEAHLEDRVMTLEPMDSIMYLPGDTVVHAMTEARTLALRIPISSEVLYWVKAKPFRTLAALRRQLDQSDSVDLIRLLQFLSSEFDRFESAEGSAQLQVLGEAIVARAQLVLERLIGFRRASNPWMLEVCSICDRYFAEHPSEWASGKQLSQLANCSVRQLYRAFEAVADATPLQYQHRVRMLSVRFAILDGLDQEVELDKLADTFGFRTHHQLTRAYAQEYGESPMETRARRESILKALKARRVRRP